MPDPSRGTALSSVAVPRSIDFQSLPASGEPCWSLGSAAGDKQADEEDEEDELQGDAHGVLEAALPHRASAAMRLPRNGYRSERFRASPSGRAWLYQRSPASRKDSF